MRAYPIATPGQRVIALLIDLAVFAIIRLILGSVLYLIGLPHLGEVVAVIFLVFRDSFPFLNYQSIGKKIMKIRVLKNGSFTIDFLTDLKRNFIFLPNLVNSIGFDSQFIGPGLTLIFLIIELYYLMEKENSRRLGDKFGNTTVVQED